MRRYHKAGDTVRVLEGPGMGRELVVSSVRMFATDNGYYLHGGDGLYPPKQVELVTERTGGNPCGTECDSRKHNLVDTCDHCRGVCQCTAHRATTADAPPRSEDTDREHVPGRRDDPESAWP